MKRRVIRTTSELKMMLNESGRIAAEQRSLPMSFAETLVMIMKRKKVTRGKLAEASMLSENTISRMRSSDDYNPTKQMVLAVCVALELSPAEAMSLFDKAGLSLKLTNAQDVAYHYILCNCGGYTLDEINVILYDSGFETIGF